MADRPVTIALKKLYGKLAGEQIWLAEPPKRVRGLPAGRKVREAGAAERTARIDEIEEHLVHLAYVINLFDPHWSRKSARTYRPRGPTNPLPVKVSAAAMDVLREASEPLTIAEIVVKIGDRYDLDLSTVRERQRYHTAVDGALKGAYGKYVEKHEGRPQRFSLRRLELPEST